MKYGSKISSDALTHLATGALILCALHLNGLKVTLQLIFLYTTHPIVARETEIEREREGGKLSILGIADVERSL